MVILKDSKCMIALTAIWTNLKVLVGRYWFSAFDTLGEIYPFLILKLYCIVLFLLGSKLVLVLNIVGNRLFLIWQSLTRPCFVGQFDLRGIYIPIEITSTWDTAPLSQHVTKTRLSYLVCKETPILKAS